MSAADDLRQTWFFGGADFAQSSARSADQAGAVVLAARLKAAAVDTLEAARRSGGGEAMVTVADFDLALVHGVRLPGQSSRSYSGILHGLHQRFGFTLLCIDPGAGGAGLEVQRHLRSPIQPIGGVDRAATPIVSPDDPDAPPVADPILVLFGRKDANMGRLFPGPSGTGLKGDDVLLDAAHRRVQELLNAGLLAVPPATEEWDPARLQALTADQRESLAALDLAMAQLIGITVATRDDGIEVTTLNGALKFSSAGRKDLAMALLYAVMAFLVWLRNRDGEWSGGSAADFGGFAVLGG